MPLLEATCEIRASIRERIWQNLHAYSSAIMELEGYAKAALSAVGAEMHAGFEQAQIAADRAKAAYESSRRELKKHIAEHGCPL